MPGLGEKMSQSYRKARPVFRTILILLMLMVLCGIVYAITRVSDPRWKEALGALAVLVFLQLFDRLLFFFELATRAKEWQDQLARSTEDSQKQLAASTRDWQDELGKRLAEFQAAQWRHALETYKEQYPASAKAGIVAIYGSRGEATPFVMQDIREVAKRTLEEVGESAARPHRVWLLGISLSEGINLDSILGDLDTVARPGGPNSSVKILLLYPFRSPAMFRTFLESTRGAIAEMLSFNRGTSAQNSDPFYSQTVYSRFEYSYRRLMQAENLRANVRFYGHYPTSWLVIIDQVAYFEPYTFGRGPDSKEGECLGGMPVLKIQKQAEGVAFDILEDHFEKLWATSDVDLFHLEVKLEERHDLVREVFRQRQGWLTHVYRVLYSRTGDDVLGANDRRRFPRQACYSNPPGLTLKWGTAAQAPVELVDFSAEGLCLKMTTGAPPPAPQLVTIEGLAARGNPGSVLIAQHFSRSCNNNFTVLPSEVNQSPDVVRLRASA